MPRTRSWPPLTHTQFFPVALASGTVTWPLRQAWVREWGLAVVELRGSAVGTGRVLLC